MNSLIFSTGNKVKYAIARGTCQKYGIEIVQKELDIDEIQGEDSKKIALDKAHKAFAILKKPVVISDDSWSIAGLNGWPGPYMSSMNAWLSVEDFLRLCQSLKDRSVVLTQFLVYLDGDTEKIFARDLSGQVLKEARGDSIHPNHRIMAMDGDGGLTIAQLTEKNNDQSSRRGADIWHEFAKWHISK